MVIKTLINILGAGRSGTTMLDLMLGNDDRSFSLGEVHAWFRPFREHHFEIVCSCGDNPCSKWSRIKELSEKDFHIKSFELLNVDFLIDSSKNLNWVIDNNLWAKNNNMRVINILLYKNIINYIYSIWKRGGSIESAIINYTNYHKRFFQTNLPCVTIKFEELTNNSDLILEQICNISGQKYFFDKKKFWVKQHHHVFGSMGTRKQTEKKESIIRKDENFPKEYLEIIPEINKLLQKNSDLKVIINKLNIYDISNGFKNKNKNIVKPYWYYLLNLKKIYNRNFPEKWKYIQ